MSKNYYALMHFDGAAVTGMLFIGYETPEQARKAGIKQLTIVLNQLKKEYPDDPYNNVQRHHAYRRTLSKPWRKVRRGSSPVLEMVELPSSMVIHTGYWLDNPQEGEHICNMSRIGEEQPLGYCCSRLKADLSMS